MRAERGLQGAAVDAAEAVARAALAGLNENPSGAEAVIDAFTGFWERLPRRTDYLAAARWWR